MDVQFSPWHSEAIPDALDNYRAYKMDWSATPWWDPAMAVRKNDNDEIVVYVSWNGATEVAYWMVRGAHNPIRGTYDEVLAEASRTGFETKMTIGETPWQYLWAEAVDENGASLGKTEIVDLTTTTLSIAYDTYDAGFTFPVPKEKVGLRAHPLRMSSVLIVTGLVTLMIVIVSVGAIWLWQRSRKYTKLEAEDFDLGHEGLSEADFDLGLEELVEEDKENDQQDGENYDEDGNNSVASQSRFQDDGRPLLSRGNPKS